MSGGSSSSPMPASEDNNHSLAEQTRSAPDDDNGNSPEQPRPAAEDDDQNSAEQPRPMADDNQNPEQQNPAPSRSKRRSARGWRDRANGGSTRAGQESADTNSENQPARANAEPKASAPTAEQPQTPRRVTKQQKRDILKGQALKPPLGYDDPEYIAAALVVVEESRKFLASKLRGRPVCMSSLGGVLSATSRAFVKKSGVGLKLLLLAHSDQFVFSGPRGKEVVSFISPESDN